VAGTRKDHNPCFWLGSSVAGLTRLSHWQDRGFGSSFKLGQGEIFVIEGDEYDTAFFDKGPKFLHYLPEIVIFNNCEFDHADIYPDFESVKTSFRRLINIIPSKGKLIAGWDDKVVRELSQKAFCPIKSFGLCEEAQWRAEQIETFETVTHFTLWNDRTSLGVVKDSSRGEFQCQNVLAAIVMLRIWALTWRRLRCTSQFQEREKTAGSSRDSEKYHSFR
jgi:UDP-N-acetylmuramate: L-alanyl-gamma-D-glutamyl-meso-diaminopimelate ligase